MSERLIRFETEDATARIVLNRPQKRNALTRQLLMELLDAVKRIEADTSARVLLLEAEGPVFCAGMDLGEMQARAGQPNAAAQWQEDTRIYRDVIERLFRLPIPTVAVVQGPVLAGGVGLVLACDVVLAAAAAFFSLPEPQRGITAAVVTPLLNYRIGPGAAGYVLLSGRRVSADDALRIGLCHEVVPAEETLNARRDALVAAILAGAPSALTLTKNTLQRCAADDLSRQLDFAMDVSAKARETDDAREGLAAFLEKRPPGWAPKSGSDR